jgi:hypothetical protein
MSQKEAVSNQHSAVSQNQHQNQRPFAAKDAEDAKESKENQLQNQKRFTTARQSRNQKRNIHHRGTETRRNPRAESTVKGKTSTQRTQRNFGERGESKIYQTKFFAG